jgi:EAL domain-containing protein (putative c-di-GMP-specific phosphodiesterase class I)
MQLLARGHWQWVKLDRGFLLTGERGRVMLRHTVAMLDELGATIVLEGVETTEQLDLARRLGIGLAQGNLLGVPVPAAELLAGLPAAGG